MADSLDETGSRPAAVTIDPEAYDESPAALYVYRQAAGTDRTPASSVTSPSQAFVDGRVRGHEAVHAAAGRGAGAALRDHARHRRRSWPCCTAPGRRSRDWSRRPAGRRRCWTSPARRSRADRVAGGRRDPAADALAERARPRRPLHRRRPPPGRGRLEEWRLAGQARGRRRALRRLPDRRPAAVRLPPPGGGPRDRGRPARPAVARSSRCGRTRAAGPGGGTFGVYVGRRWFAPTSGAAADGRAGLDVARPATPGPRAAGRGAAPGRTCRDRPGRRRPRRADPDAATSTAVPCSRWRRPRSTYSTRLADGGEVMPPKTTYFEPKPCAGIFLRR